MVKSKRESHLVLSFPRTHNGPKYKCFLLRDFTDVLFTLLDIQKTLQGDITKAPNQQNTLKHGDVVQEVQERNHSSM